MPLSTSNFNSFSFFLFFSPYFHNFLFLYLIFFSSYHVLCPHLSCFSINILRISEKKKYHSYIWIHLNSFFTYSSFFFLFLLDLYYHDDGSVHYFEIKTKYRRFQKKWKFEIIWMKIGQVNEITKWYSFKTPWIYTLSYYQLPVVLSKQPEYIPFLTINYLLFFHNNLNIYPFLLSTSCYSFTTPRIYTLSYYQLPVILSKQPEYIPFLTINFLLFFQNTLHINPFLLSTSCYSFKTPRIYTLSYYQLPVILSQHPEYIPFLTINFLLFFHNTLNIYPFALSTSCYSFKTPWIYTLSHYQLPVILSQHPEYIPFLTINFLLFFHNTPNIYPFLRSTSCYSFKTPWKYTLSYYQLPVILSKHPEYIPFLTINFLLFFQNTLKYIPFLTINFLLFFHNTPNIYPFLLSTSYYSFTTPRIYTLSYYQLPVILSQHPEYIPFLTINFLLFFQNTPNIYPFLLSTSCYSFKTPWIYTLSYYQLPVILSKHPEYKPFLTINFLLFFHNTPNIYPFLLSTSCYSFTTPRIYTLSYYQLPVILSKHPEYIPFLTINFLLFFQNTLNIYPFLLSTSCYSFKTPWIYTLSYYQLPVILSQHPEYIPFLTINFLLFFQNTLKIYPFLLSTSCYSFKTPRIYTLSYDQLPVILSKHPKIYTLSYYQLPVILSQHPEYKPFLTINFLLFFHNTLNIYPFLLSTSCYSFKTPWI